MPTFCTEPAHTVYSIYSFIVQATAQHGRQDDKSVQMNNYIFKSGYIEACMCSALSLTHARNMHTPL